MSIMSVLAGSTGELSSGATPATPARTRGLRDRAVHDAYREHGTALHKYVTGLVAGDRQHAEDVVQETMLRAWRSAEASPGRPSLRPWLFTVARRIVIDTHRARTVRPREIATDTMDEASGIDQVDQMLSGLVVSDAIAALSPDHRAVLREVYLRGHRIEDAARTLGIPVGTVKSRTYYALKALRLALAERGVTGQA
jgi:RNA polymerase sigma-70 factor (ECF subfamily)